MQVLAIDVGSSSVKMGVLRNGRIVGKTIRADYPTRYSGNRAEVNPDAILNAIEKAAHQLSDHARRVDVIAIDSMSPSWIAMDSRGKPLTAVITHQDRRSVEVAEEIERQIGKEKHLKLAGSRPVPGGISSTTCAWFFRHQKALMRRADLIGHFTTFLHRTLCGTRVVDPSHASFMGLYSTLTLKGWNQELCDVVGVSRNVLPEIHDANQIGGKLSSQGAPRLGLQQGTPMLVGFIDTGGAMLLCGAKVGQLVNVVGSTDVLALCTDRPKPHEKLLTRALGVGRKWVSVGTIGAAGSSLLWAKEQLFADLSEKSFFNLVSKVAAHGRDARDTVEFEPYLAGDRCSVEQRRAVISGLTLSSTRENILKAIVEALAHASAERLDLLRSTGTKIDRNVLISGGGDGQLAKIMQRDWAGKWKFHTEKEATLKGLYSLAAV